MKSTPSPLALLGLIAFAGYQNRSKVSEMNDDAQQRQPADAAQSHPSFMAGFSDMFRSGTIGGRTQLSGLGDLLNRFISTGQDRTAQSRVATGPNKLLQDADVVKAFGTDTIDERVTNTGLPRAELIRRRAIERLIRETKS